MPRAGLIMAGHLHPPIIRLISETVWMVGDFTRSDASWTIATRWAFKCPLDALTSKMMDQRIPFSENKKEQKKYSRRNGALKGCISEIP